MAQIFPFRAYRYNASRVRPERVLTQPYDKITPAMQENYYAADPCNLVAVEKGRSFPDDTPRNNVYTRAAATLENWIAQGILLRDAAPSFYAYFQEYTVPGAADRRVRKSFIGLGRLEDYSAKIVFRHERTLAGPKADRLELLRRTRAHTGQLFMLYSDAERRMDALLDEAARNSPAVDLRDEFGVAHRLWPISGAARVAGIQRRMTDQKLVIADGHHRYETALAYRDECRACSAAPAPDAPHEKVMMTFVNSRSEGLTILPTHRVVAGLSGFDFARFAEKLAPYFAVAVHPLSHSQGRQQSAHVFRSLLQEKARDRGQRSIGVYARRGTPPGAEPGFFLLTLKPEVNLADVLPDVSPLQRNLDVVLLHRLVLEKGLGITTEDVVREKNLAYEREMEAAMAAVDRGAAQIAFFLDSVDVAQVMEIAAAAEVLPQKSTDFYPKLLSGITIYRLEDGA